MAERGRSDKAATGGLVDRVPAPALFAASGVTQYVGAAIAVGLFTTLAAPAVAWWRLALSALVLLAWRRPWRDRWQRSDLAAAVTFGLVLATMNVAFYVAIDHLPLGTAVAIEFLGPVAVAGIIGRGWRDRVGIGLAAAGVVLLAGVQLNIGGGPGAVVGLVAIGVAAASWAGYILLGRRLAVRGDGLTMLSVGMAAGAVVYLPAGVGTVTAALMDPRLLFALLGVAVLSSVVPYAIEQLVLRRVPAARFAILLAMLPATALLVGVVLLGQRPTLAELIGIALVCVAIVLSGQRPPRPAPPAPLG